MSNLISHPNIDSWIRKILPYFLGFTFITTMAGSYSSFLEHNAWKIGDWLINYQGGLIRRGLFGEIIFNLSQLSHINPGLLVVFFQTIFYALFFFFSYCLLTCQKNLIPYIFLIFSPFIFTFQINDYQGGYRKEIIYFACLAILTWTANNQKKEIFERIFHIMLLIYPAIILTHEIFVIFLPYLFIIYNSVFKLTRERLTHLICLLFPSFVAIFFVVTHHKITPHQVQMIYSSLENLNYSLQSGSIAWLDKNIKGSGLEITEWIQNHHYLFYYAQVWMLSIITFIPAHSRCKHIYQNTLWMLLIGLSIFGSIALYFIIYDWGRHMYMHLVSLFFLLLLPLEKNEEAKANQKNTHPLVIILFFLYTLFWHIPHCCFPQPYPRNYKEINAVAYLIPYARIARHYGLIDYQSSPYKDYTP